MMSSSEHSACSRQERSVSSGAVVSSTVMVCVAVVLLPQSSVDERANHRVVACSVASQRLAEDTSMLTAPQLSDAEASSKINSSE